MLVASTEKQVSAVPTVPQAAAIEIRDLVVTYGSKRAVDGLSLTVPVGTIYGFLGPNGAGKTTTIKALLGFRPPDGGSANVLGHDIVRESTELRTHTGYVSEANSLYDNLTVPQVTDFYRSTARRWNQQVVDRYMEMFGLPSQVKVRQLSNGMKRQLALSLAMGGEPDLLILDEPTSGLDPIARHDLLNKLVEIAAEGKTIFFSSHILSEVEAVADWVGIIRDGKLVVSDELDHLKQSQKVLKLIYAQAPTAQEIATLSAMPGVTRVEQEGRSVRLMVQGDAEALAHTIQQDGTRELRDVDIVNLNLEDLFLEYMKEGGNGR
jgi:ABC-2 type transport system ATP-binding protein